MTGAQRRRVGAIATIVVAVASIVPALVLAARDGRLTELPPADLGAAVSLSVVGAFLLIRGAVANVATIVAVQGVTASMTVYTSIATSHALRDGGTLRGFAQWQTLFGDIIWLPGVVLLIPLILLFPDGRPPGRGWRWLTIVAVALGSVFALVGICFEHPLDDGATLAQAPNPAGFIRVGSHGWQLFNDYVGSTIVPALGLTLLAAVAGLVVKRRRASGPVRAQVSCLVYGAAVTALLFVLSSAIPDNALWSWLVAFFGIVPIAVAIGVAVLRYRLWEIDRLVSRTVAYVVVLAMLAGVFVGVLAALAALVPSDYGQVGVASATLAVTVLAVPLLRRVRRGVDRRFDRSRFDAERVVAAFATRLRGRPDREDVPADLLAVVGRTVQPAHATVWLLPRASTPPVAAP